MTARCCKADGNKIKHAIFNFNLKVEGVSYSSGSMEHLENGVPVKGGYIVRQKKEVIGWGVAFGNNEFHMYVRPHARKHGIASKIIRRAAKDFKGHYFCPWNKETLEIFKYKKVKYTNMYLPWNILKYERN